MASSKRMKPRLLPFVIGAAVLLLTLKLDALWHGRGPFTQDAMAQTATALTPGEFQHAPAINPADAVPQRDANPPPVLPAPMTPLTQQAALGAGVARNAFVGAPGDSASAAGDCSPAEAQAMNDVAARRAALDKRSEELDRRALLLKAVEQRLDGKIQKLQQMKNDIAASLGQVDQQQQDRLTSLVHIYENMKPQLAAGILQQMDMSVLLQILTRMRDLRTAPILAAMDPDKARAVTLALAEKQQLPADVTAGAQSN